MAKRLDWQSDGKDWPNRALSRFVEAGGQRWHARGMPFFVGLLIGDYVLGCMWPIAGWVTGRTMYSFQQ